MISCDVFSEAAGRVWLSHNSQLGINGMDLESTSWWAGGGCSFSWARAAPENENQKGKEVSFAQHQRDSACILNKKI